MTLIPLKSLGSTSQNRNQIKSSDLQRQGHTQQVFRAFASKFDFYSSQKTETLMTQRASIQTLETEVEGILYDLVEVWRYRLNILKHDAIDKIADQKYLQKIKTEVAPENQISFDEMLVLARKDVGYLDKIIPLYEDLLKNIQDGLDVILKVSAEDDSTKHS
ncbi:MAG: hypothetical protein HEQ32_04530 [Vampirovibrio sp.]